MHATHSSIYETGRRHVNVIKQMQFSYDYSNILNGHI